MSKKDYLFPPNSHPKLYGGTPETKHPLPFIPTLEWQTLSNALCKSTITPITLSPLTAESVTDSRNWVAAVTTDKLCLNPCCHCQATH